MNQQTHKDLVNDVRLACSDEDTRVFLNSTGTGYPIETIKALQSHIKKNFPQLDKVVSDFIKRSPRITYGLAVGSNDLIAIKRIKITPDMVGTVIGVFCGVEVKTPDDDLRTEQKSFIKVINELGGRSGVARGPNHIKQAKEILNNG